MALIMKYIDSINRYMDHYGDSRTRDWAMMSSPFPTLAVCLTYVYLVKVLGPRIMENRKPFQLQNTLVLYNLFQVIFSAWLFYESLMGGWWGQYSFRCQPVDYSDSPTAKRIGISGWFTGHYNFRCQPVDYSNHPRTLRMANVCWWYYFSKFTEFFDTIFFVLRKKTSQVSTLHVIHHGCMPMSVWFGVKFTPGGHSTFFGLLNTFVHIVMYSYYLFAAMGPQFQKYLWWKKYLTALQMVQFVLIMSHAFQLLFIECNYPKAFVWWIGMHAVLFFFLFNQFYKDTYKTNELRKAKLKAQRLEQERLLQEQQQKQQNGTLTNGYQNGKISNGLNGHIESNGSITSNGYTHNHNGHITSNGHGYTNGDILNKTLYELSKTTTTTTTDNSRTDDQINNGYRKIVNDDNIEITQRKIQK